MKKKERKKKLWSLPQHPRSSFKDNITKVSEMVVTDGLEIVEIATVVFKGNLFGKSSLSNIIFLLV